MVLTVPEIRKRFFGYKPVERPPTSYPRKPPPLLPRVSIRSYSLTPCYPHSLHRPHPESEL